MTSRTTTAATLPNPDDGVDALVQLGDVLGADYVFRLLRAISLNRPGTNGMSASTEAQSVLASRLVDDVRAKSGDPHMTYDQARRIVADQLGYTAKTRTNFYKILEGKPRTKAGS